MSDLSGPVKIPEVNGWDVAEAGGSILSNPYPEKTPGFNKWVDGWCAYHTEAGAQRKADAAVTDRSCG